MRKESGLEPQTDLAGLVRKLRQRTGLTQEQFAARLGVTFPTINRWENRRAKPSPLAMRRIEELLHSMGDSEVVNRGPRFKDTSGE
ncbi:MAG: helix-turn-helix transcriptional regulator [Chloroflexota bacterium]